MIKDISINKIEKQAFEGDITRFEIADPSTFNQNTADPATLYLFTGGASGPGNYITADQTGLFYPASNPSGFISTVVGSFYPMNSNPSGYIRSNQTGAFYPASNPSGFVTSASLNLSNYVATSQTGQFYASSNPSGFITGISNLVYTTGAQSINGSKDFLLRPTVNGSGILLNGEVQNNTIISGVVYSAQINVKNGEGSTIYKGQPVYIKGADGTNIVVGLASNTSEGTSSKTLGFIVQDSLLNNASGTVITDGLLQNFNTSAAVAGDPIWLGPTGSLIYGLANKPYAPNHLVYLGVVTRAQNNGEIFVKVQNGFELDELHDVAVTGSLNGQFLYKNNNLWSGKSLQISDVSNLQASLDSKQTTGSYYLASNPSGFITGVNLSNYVTNSQTGNFVTSSQTGAFYPASNPSGYVRNTQTGAFYASSNPSGYIGSTVLSNYITTTGPHTINGTLTFTDPPLETKATPSISAGTLTLNLANASFFYVSLNAAITTMTLQNVPASPAVVSFTLQFVADGTARAVTWPAGTRWAGGTNPTMTSTLNKVDTFVFTTHDGGANWFAFVSSQNQ